MKVLSWNVNGLRAVLKNQGKSLASFLDSLDADIICLQETKATRDQLDSTTYAAPGYNAYFSFSRAKTGYSGVVTFCRDSVTPLRAEEGLGGASLERRDDGVGCYCDTPASLSQELHTLDFEGRCVITEHAIQDNACGRGLAGTLVVVNLYCPRVDADNLTRLDYQLKFYTALMERGVALEKEGKHIIVVGDFNCSIAAIDSAYAQDDPTLLDTPSRKYFLQFIHSQLCTPGAQTCTSAQTIITTAGAHTCTGAQTITTTAGAQTCTAAGAQSHPLEGPQPRLLDVYRSLHPTTQGAYSWWHTVTDSRKVNYGKRIDLVLCGASLWGQVEGSEVCQGVLGSDHCPVTASFSLPLERAPRPPSLCSKYFVEFSGKQQTLSSLWASAKVAAATPTKRSSPGGSHGDGGRPAAKQRKDAKSCLGKRSIASFFGATVKGGEEEEGKGVELGPQDDVADASTGGDLDGCHGYHCEVAKPLSSEWRSVFSAPKQVLCSGHQEPCVLRTAKKQGPNYNRQFYCCARPGGFKGDANARCNFFMWTTKHRKAA